MRVLVFGDSITQGFWDTEGGWAARLRKHYDLMRLKDLSKETPTVFNLGISGETSTHLLKRLENEIRARDGHGQELCIVIAIGTNDNLFESHEQWTNPDQFIKNIKDLCEIAGKFSDKILFFGANAVNEELTTPVSWGDFSYTNKELERYEKITQKVVEDQGYQFVPLFDLFKSTPGYKKLLSDGLHPNDKGHQMMFEVIQPELDRLIAA